MHTAPPNLLDNGCNQNYLCSVILINQHTKLTVMKNLLIASAVFICSLMSQASFANTGKENPAVLQAFGNDFAAAKDVQWTVTENLYRATFVYNGQIVSAFYSADGTQLALSRNITSDRLPVTLLADLKKGYGQYWISDLFEMTDAGGVSYYVTLENGDSKIVLKSESNLNWGTYQKTKKA